MALLKDHPLHHHQPAAYAGRFNHTVSDSCTGKTSDISKSPKQQLLTMRTQIILRASDIGDHSPHNVGNENDPMVHQSRWLNNSFPGLLLPDQIWGEAIKVSRLWEEWSLTGLVQNPVFCQLLHNGVWDSCESGRPAAEVTAMRHSAALSSRLMLRALEQEEKVSLWVIQRLLFLTQRLHSTTSWRGSGDRSRRRCGTLSSIGSMRTWRP